MVRHKIFSTAEPAEDTDDAVLLRCISPTHWLEELGKEILDPKSRKRRGAQAKMESPGGA